MDLLLAVAVLIVLSPFVDVLLTVLQHAIDESREAVSHGSDGFGSTQFGAQTAVLGASKKPSFQPLKRTGKHI